MTNDERTIELLEALRELGDLTPLTSGFAGPSPRSCSRLP
jgi:hypothetical protein